MSGGKLNLLVAYPYMQPPMIKTLNENAAHIRFVLDSGAFTAWKAGKSIELDDYCRFIESLPFKPWRYFTLDVIGNPEASMKNYEAMLKRGFKPIPIFTRGEDPSVINDYYKTSDVVGIGGLVGTPNNKGFVNGIMKHIKDRKVHWLGFTSMDFIKYYKPYMCDSSSWESGARYGVAKIYMGQGRFATVKRTDFAKKQKQEIIQRIRHLGINPSDLIKNAGWAGGPSASRNLCAASAVNLSSELEIKLGVKMFNALTTVQAAGLLMKHYQARQDR